MGSTSSSLQHVKNSIFIIFIIEDLMTSSGFQAMKLNFAKNGSIHTTATT